MRFVVAPAKCRRSTPSERWYARCVMAMMHQLRERSLLSEMEGVMVSLTIPITGMSCGGCVNSIRNALSKIPGVKDAQVKVGAATVTYDPALTNAEALRGAITQAGYALAVA